VKSKRKKATLVVCLKVKKHGTGEKILLSRFLKRNGEFAHYELTNVCTEALLLIMYQSSKFVMSIKLYPIVN